MLVKFHPLPPSKVRGDKFKKSLRCHHLEMRCRIIWYCWWKKSCTSWQVVHPMIYMVLYIPGGWPDLFHHQLSWDVESQQPTRIGSPPTLTRPKWRATSGMERNFSPLLENQYLVFFATQNDGTNFPKCSFGQKSRFPTWSKMSIIQQNWIWEMGVASCNSHLIYLQLHDIVILLSVGDCLHWAACSVFQAFEFEVRFPDDPRKHAIKTWWDLWKKLSACKIDVLVSKTLPIRF